jgi:hypothetical protein
MLFDDFDYKVLIWIFGLLGLFFILDTRNLTAALVCAAIIILCFFKRIRLKIKEENIRKRISKRRAEE